MINEGTFAALIAAIYDAAIDFNQWSQALCEISRICASHTTVLTRQGDSPVESWSVAPQCDRIYYERYGHYYHGVNPLWHRAASAAAGTVMTDAMIMPNSELVRTEFYNDFLVPQRLGSMLSAVALVEQGRQTVIAAHRQPDFGPDHVSLFQRLVPHFQRAVQLNIRLAELELHHQASAEALNRLEQGALLVDASACVVFANREAERLLDGGGLRLAEGALHAETVADTMLLHELLAAARAQERMRAPAASSRYRVDRAGRRFRCCWRRCAPEQNRLGWRNVPQQSCSLPIRTARSYRRSTGFGSSLD